MHSRKILHEIGLIASCIIFSFTFQVLSQTFTKLTTGIVVNDGGNSRGCSWGDYDNDGDLDLFVGNWQEDDNFLYANNGDGSFTKITSGVIVNDYGSSYNGAWGDYDNDGDLDLFVANFNGENNFLYANNGNGSFTRVTSGAIVNDGGHSRSASWGDYDNDSYLDLFVANGFDQNNFLYHNNGDGTFTKITTGSIVNDGGNSVGCNWADFDNDDDPDLFVANIGGLNNFLYRNNNDGTFTRITAGVIVNEGGSQGGSWADYDNDGDLDLMMANHDNQNNYLYANNGDGSFTKITAGVIVNDGGSSEEVNWGDYDNDGDLDVFVANWGGQNSFFYTSNGDGTFNKVTTGIIVNDGGTSYASSCGDYNNDGFPDIFVSNGFGENNSLYKNDGNANNWINIKCIGTSFTNYSAIGARVKVKATISGNPAGQMHAWQMQEISSAAGNRSQNSLNVEFGLGDATVIDSLVVLWPASDTANVLTEVVPNQFLTIYEPVVPFLISVSPDSGYQGYPVTVQITGKNTNFDQGGGTLNVWLSQGDSIIQANTFLANSSISLTADFNIPLTAPMGLWNLSVETALDGIITFENSFKIKLPPPIITVDTDSIYKAIQFGDSADVNILVSNNAAPGATSLSWSALALSQPMTLLTSQQDRRGRMSKDSDQSEQFVNFTAGTHPPSVHRAPANINSSERSPVGANSLELPGKTAYGYEFMSANFIKFGLDTPQNIEPISYVPGNFYGGDFGPNGAFYLIDNFSGMLMTIDTLSGALTPIGAMLILPGHAWTGLSYDVTTNTLYASSTDIFVSALYTVDSQTAATTLVGTTTAAPGIIDIACDNFGTIYAHDIVTDAIYILDKNSAAATLVGATGFDANYAQGMDFDPFTGDLYLAAYNNSSFTAELRHVDLITGFATFIGFIGSGFSEEVDALGIGGIGSPPFVKLLPPASGIIGPGDVQLLKVRLFGLQEPDTTYSALILIVSSDPFNPTIEIPVQVDVLVGLDPINPLPINFQVSQNYPNPFNLTSVIDYQLPQASEVKLVIYNILGQKIHTLVNTRKPAGYHHVVWDGRDDMGVEVASGIYVYRFQAIAFSEKNKKFVKTHKMMLLK